MGILNVTPDSFSDGSQYQSVQDAVNGALQMMDDGADLIDVGGESTRPGAVPVSDEEELQRVLPVLEQLAEREIPFSIDTRKPEVARKALELGAKVLNDITGLRNKEMLKVAADSDCSVCIMHMQGDPQTMQSNPTYVNVMEEIKEFLQIQAEEAQEAGVKKERIWIDPGIGFGKTVEHNLAILRHFEQFVEIGYPVLIGVSRKAFLAKIASQDEPLLATERVEASIAAQCIAQMKGVKIIRAHDVKQAARAIKVVAAILDAPA
jgi:dihydropteroate synthase